MRTIKQIDLEIEKLEKEKEELKNKVKFRKFKCLPNLEVSQIKDHQETFDKIVIPQGCRLMRIWEFAKLIESDESDEFLGDYKGKWSYFYLEQTKYAKKNNYVASACVVRDGDWVSIDVDLAYSGDDGRVVFVRDLEVKNE